MNLELMRMLLVELNAGAAWVLFIGVLGLTAATVSTTWVLADRAHRRLNHEEKMAAAQFAHAEHMLQLERENPKTVGGSQLVIQGDK